MQIHYSFGISFYLLQNVPTFSHIWDDLSQTQTQTQMRFEQRRVRLQKSRIVLVWSGDRVKGGEGWQAKTEVGSEQLEEKERIAAIILR